MRFEAFIEQASYGSVVALHQISLRVDPGKVVGILGANGAGKTTMIRALLNNIAAAKRTVSLGETDLSALPTWKWRSTAWVRSRGSWCFENMSVMENLTSPFAVNEKYIERKNMQELLHVVFKLFPVLKARKSQLAGTLSGGERKMLAIGRVLMLSPKVMLLDEPSSGLAPIMVKELYKAIEAIKAAGKWPSS
jgi:branched-chain amino acid transport system ATP-binding protein